MSVLRDALQWVLEHAAPPVVRRDEGPDLVLEQSKEGQRYVLPPVPQPRLCQPLFRAAHILGGFEALKAWQVWGLPLEDGTRQPPDSVWLSAKTGHAVVRAPFSRVPEEGAAQLELDVSPEWSRWAKVVGSTAPVDLDHEALAELLLDNEEDLEEPALAKVAAQFRGVRSVTYDADLQGQGHVGVRVEFSGKGGAGNVALPREFQANLRGYFEAWPDGGAPRRPARFRLRVVPPKKDGGPVFRLYWLNLPEFEAAALDDLEARVREVYGDKVVRGLFSASSFEPFPG